LLIAVEMRAAIAPYALICSFWFILENSAGSGTRCKLIFAFPKKQVNQEALLNPFGVLSLVSSLMLTITPTFCVFAR
jgi:hypothetical protein